MAGAIISEIAHSDSLDFSSRPVPLDQRMAKGGLTMAWWACSSAVFYLVVAATLAEKFGTKNAIIGLLLSVAAYSAINAVVTRYAIRTGLSVALFSRILFGNAGAALATLIFFLTATYYAVFEGSIIAIGISHVFPVIDYRLASFLVVLYSVPLVLGSVQNWLNKFNGILFPFYIFGLVMAVALTLFQYGYSDHWLSVGARDRNLQGGWWYCFVYLMGIWIQMIYTFKYARFGDKNDTEYRALFNFGAPYFLMTFVVNGLVGIFLVGTIPLEGPLTETSVLFALLKLMGIGGLLFVWVSQTRINTANYYLAAANMESFFAQALRLRLGKTVWAIVVGVAAFLLMLANVFSYLLQALTYQGIFVVAWVAVAVTHILSQRGTATLGEVEYDRSPSFNPAGLIAWFGGSVVGLILQHFGGLTGSFSAPSTAVAAAGLYKILFVGGRPGASEPEEAANIDTVDTFVIVDHFSGREK